MLFRSLTVRLTLGLAVVLGLVQVTLVLLFDSALEGNLRRRFSESLLRRVESVAEVHELAQARDPSAEPERLWNRTFAAYESSELLLTAVLPDGKRVSSDALKGFDLPSFDGQRFRWRPDELPGRVDEPFQVVRYNLADGTQLYAAGSAATIEANLADTRQMIWILAALAVLATLAVGGWITHRGLSPLVSVTRRLREATASNLNNELPLPPVDDELRELVEAYNRMVVRVSQQIHEQRQFMGRAAHELKTPLAVLSGRLQTNADAFSDIKLRDNLLSEIRRMLRVVNGFLILSRAEQRISLANARVHSLEDIVIQGISRCAEEARGRAVRVVPNFDHDDSREPLVRGDSDLLLSLLDNLVRNAIRHSPEGQVVSVSVDIVHDKVVLRVSDRGPGIAAELQVKIFHAFYQGDVRARAGEGGLGLAIVRSVAELHSGHVQVESHPGSGSSFVVTLPLAD